MDFKSFYGVPKKNTILASADSLYFLAHGKALINSCNKYGNNLHIHIINPTNEVLNKLKKENISSSYSNHVNPSKAYYACSRFIVAPYILDTADKLLIVDIDCYLRKHFDFFPNNIELGLFIRDSLNGSGWVKRGTRVAAGMVYLNTKTKEYISLVNKLLSDFSTESWYVDQLVLYTAWNILYNNPEKLKNFIKFDNTYLDWNFTPNSYIWTGKGNRKHVNKQYLKGKEELENSSI